MNRPQSLVTVSAVAALASMLAAACAAPTSGSAAGEETSADEIQQHRPDSTYTDVVFGSGACKEIPLPGEEGELATEWECKGSGPDYKLALHEGDLRMRATLIGPGGAEHAIDPYAVIPQGAHFNTIGPKAEWRTKQGDAAHPYALILRHVFEAPSSEEEAGDPNASWTKHHYLAVTKIDGSTACLVAVVEASKNSANANVLARNAADAARTRPCPDPEQVTLVTK
jgi:hypothetical protein